MKFPLLVILSLLLLQACYVGSIKEFEAEDLKWFQPYSKTHSVVFVSDSLEYDTITFYKTDTTRFSKRDIEQGFYDQLILSVAYNFSPGSYHQLATMSDGQTKYNQDIFRIGRRSSGNFTDREYIFIGMIFSGSELETITQLNKRTYFFERSKATYPEMNVMRGINNFTFNTTTGVTEYTDTRNVKWRRVNS